MDTTRYKEVNGYRWPLHDTECMAVVFSTFNDARLAMDHCTRKRTVIQAGGNCGVWANGFAEHFANVLTFEPDPTNFHCLLWNTKKTPNVHSFCAGLGHQQMTATIDTPEGNCGAAQIDLRNGRVSIITIDSLEPRDVDLIYLDVEGFEYFALKGARNTIDYSRPVVAFEDKGLSERYGIPQGDAEIYMAMTHGYKVIARPNRDVIMVPA